MQTKVPTSFATYIIRLLTSLLIVQLLSTALLPADATRVSSQSVPATITVEIWDDVDGNGDITTQDMLYDKSIVTVQGADDRGEPAQFIDQASVNPLDYDSRIGAISLIFDAPPSAGFDIKRILDLANGYRNLSNHGSCKTCINGVHGLDAGDSATIRLLVGYSTEIGADSSDSGIACIYSNKQPPFRVGSRLRIFIAVSRTGVPAMPQGFEKLLECTDIAIYPEMRVRIFGAEVQNSEELLKFKNTLSPEFLGWEALLRLESDPQDFLIQVGHSDLAPWVDIQPSQPLPVKQTFMSRYGQEGVGALIGAAATLLAVVLTIAIPMMLKISKVATEPEISDGRQANEEVTGQGDVKP